MAGMSAKIRAEAAAGTPSTSDVYLGPAAFAIPMIKRKVLLSRPWTKYLPGRITQDRIHRAAFVHIPRGLTLARQIIGIGLHALHPR